MASSYKSIDAAIDKDGKLHIRTSGFSGKTCLKEAERLIKLLQQAGLEVNTEDLQLTEEATDTRAFQKDSTKVEGKR